MFMIRTAFWLGLVVLLLPTDKQQQAKLVSTASETVQRVATFCDRNEATCDKGAELWAMFKTKAEFGGRMAMDLINQRNDAPEPAIAAVPAGKPGVSPAALRTEPGRGTLRGTDLAPVWRGAPERTGQRS